MPADRHPFSGGIILKRPSEAKESWNLIQNTKVTTSSKDNYPFSLYLFLI